MHLATLFGDCWVRRLASALHQQKCIFTLMRRAVSPSSIQSIKYTPFTNQEKALARATPADAPEARDKTIPRLLMVGDVMGRVEVLDLA